MHYVDKGNGRKMWKYCIGKRKLLFRSFLNSVNFTVNFHISLYSIKKNLPLAKQNKRELKWTKLSQKLTLRRQMCTKKKSCFFSPSKTRLLFHLSIFIPAKLYPSIYLFYVYQFIYFFFIGTYSARLFKYEHKNIPPLASLSLLFVSCLPHQNSIKSNNTDLLISQPHNRKKKSRKVSIQEKMKLKVKQRYTCQYKY